MVERVRGGGSRSIEVEAENSKKGKTRSRACDEALSQSLSLSLSLSLARPAFSVPLSLLPRSRLCSGNAAIIINQETHHPGSTCE